MDENKSVRAWFLTAFLFGLSVVAASYLVLIRGGNTGLARGLPAELPNLTEITSEPRRIAPGSRIIGKLELRLPDGYKLAERAPSRLRVYSSECPDSVEQDISDESSGFSIEGGCLIQTADLLIEAVLYYCPSKAATLCYIKSFRYVQPIEVLAGGEPRLKLLLNAALALD